MTFRNSDDNDDDDLMINNFNNNFGDDDDEYEPFFHHYQGSIDFNTVNIHRTVGMYFLVSTGNRDDIE